VRRGENEERSENATPDAGTPPDTGVPFGASVPPDTGVPFGASVPPDTGVPFGASVPPGAGVTTGADVSPGSGVPAGEGAPDGRDGLQRGLGLAYRYLNRRDRTEAEVRGHLDDKRIDAPDVEQSIATLREQGYLDDARYARLLAQDKRNLEGWGNDRIRRTLSSRGIDRELIEDAVASREEPAAELDRALALLRRRFPSPPQERRERDRALAVLLRKGYDADLALDALARYASGWADT
jgi:regulatory protein